jgi:hypothetical protein
MNIMDVHNLTLMKSCFFFFTLTILPTATTRIILWDVRSVVRGIINKISEKKLLIGLKKQQITLEYRYTSTRMYGVIFIIRLP